MNTVTIVVVGIWNGMLFVLLAFVVRYRKRIVPWITELDRVDRARWDQMDDDKWSAFLTDHPELIDR